MNGMPGRPLLPRRTVNDKVCSRCGETKPATEFHQDMRNPDFLTYACRACLNRPRVTNPATAKECNSCHVTKPAEEFPRDNRKRDGRGARCRDCVNQRRRKTPRGAVAA